MQKELILILSLFVLASCTQVRKPQSKVAPLKVKVQVVASQEVQSTARYMGTVEACQETPLSMQSAGRVTAVYVKEGEDVRKGQVILRIDSTQAMNALHTAKAAFEQAQDGYERAKKVHAKGGVTDQKMVEIESQLTQARSLYQAAQRQVSECQLVAPCAGTVSGLDVKVGQTIVPGLHVCSLLDMSSYSVRFTVPESEISAIRVGQKGEAECVSNEQVYPFTVKEKGLKANPVVHTYEVVARLEGSTRDLMPGMIIRCQLTNNPSPMTHIIIPARCVLIMPEGATVWVAEQGRAQRRAITIDGYQADGVRVLTGLQAGDTLIIDGYQKLYKDCELIIDN